MNNYEPLFTKVEAEHPDLPPGLLKTIAQIESSNNPAAVGPKTRYGTAKGLFQFIEPTAKEYGVSDPFDPEQATRGAAAYLTTLAKRYDGDWVKALAAYNWGPGNVDRKGLDKAPPETVNYIAKAGRLLPGLLNAMVPAAEAAEPPNAGRVDRSVKTLDPADEEAIFGQQNQGLSPDDEAAIFGKPDAWVQEHQKDKAKWKAQLDAYNARPPAEETRGQRFGLGAAAPYIKLGQIESRGLEAAANWTGIPELQKAAADRRAFIDQTAKDLQRERRDLKPEGIDWAGGAGEAAGLLPAAAVLPAASTVGGAAGVGALSGGISGALNPIEDTNQFWGKTAADTAGGTVAGALTGPAVYGISKGLGYIADKVAQGVRKLAGAASPAKVDQVLEMELKAQGVDFAGLDQATKDTLRRDVSKALSLGDDLNPEALANKAAFEDLGIQGTRGQILRDPKQWQDEFNLRQLTGGEDLMNQYRDATTGLVRNLNETRAGTGGADITPYAAGEHAINALGKLDKSVKGQVDAAYQAARNQVGIHTPLDSRNFADRVIQKLDDDQVGDKLPSALRTTLNQISTGDFPFTIQKAEQVLRAANQRASQSADKVEKHALGIFTTELRDAIDNAGSSEGQAAAAAFQNARKLASGRFQLQDAVPALKAVADGDITPDDFLKKFVFGAKVGELKSLRTAINKSDPEAWHTIRAQLIDKLKAVAVQGEGNDARFLQAAYNKALNSVPMEKMRILFSPQEIQKLKLIGKVGRAIQQEPVGAVPNRSGTAAAILNRLGSVLEKIPGLGTAGSVIVRGTLKAGQSGVNSLKASSALGNAPISTPNKLLNDRIRAALIQGGGAFGAAAVTDH